MVQTTNRQEDRKVVHLPSGIVDVTDKRCIFPGCEQETDCSWFDTAEISFCYEHGNMFGEMYKVAWLDREEEEG